MPGTERKSGRRWWTRRTKAVLSAVLGIVCAIGVNQVGTVSGDAARWPWQAGLAIAVMLVAALAALIVEPRSGSTERDDASAAPAERDGASATRRRRGRPGARRWSDGALLAGFGLVSFGVVLAGLLAARYLFWPVESAALPAPHPVGTAAGPPPSGALSPVPGATAAAATAASPGTAGDSAEHPMKEQRVVHLPVSGADSLDLDYLGQRHDGSGDLHIDATGIRTLRGAKLAIIEDEPEADWARCARVTDWRTEVKFAELHEGSQLCALSDDRWHVMLKVSGLPSSPGSNGRFSFFARSWYL